MEKMHKGVEELFQDDISSDEMSDCSSVMKVEPCEEGVSEKTREVQTCVPYLAPLRRSTFSVAHFTAPTGSLEQRCVKADGISAASESLQYVQPTARGMIDEDDEKSILQVNLEALFNENTSAPSSFSTSTIPICSHVLHHLGVSSGKFRMGQQEVVLSILQGHNTLAVFPTGWGKTICFLFPMLVYRMLFNAKFEAWKKLQHAADSAAEATVSSPSARFGVVVSPLLSLMNDQAARIAKNGALRAVVLSSGTSASHEQAILEDLESPVSSIDLVFVSPERLVRHVALRGVFERQLHRIALICVDEAHCVSQWAHDFRPCFMYVHRVLENITAKAAASGKTKLSPPFLCLTATASPSVVEELRSVFCIERTVTVPYCRDNLVLEAVPVVDVDSKAGSPTQQMLQGKVLQAVLELPKPMLVYVQTRVDADELANSLLSKIGAAKGRGPKSDRSDSSSIFTSSTHKHLCKNGDGAVGADERNRLIIRSFHAALDRHVRSRTQREFMQGNIDVLIATVAFGMGIDKPNIRTVVHASAPSSLESYVQETGRAGRDGLMSICRLLYNPYDYYTLRSRILASIVSPTEMLMIVQHILGSPVSKYGEKVTMVSPTKIAEELMIGEETIETVLFMLLTWEKGVLRELCGTAPMGYRVTCTVSEVSVVAEHSVSRKRKRPTATPSGVSNMLGQLDVLDGVLDLCRKSKRIEHLLTAANTLNLSLQDFQFRLNDLVSSGLVSLQQLSPAYILSVGEQFDEVASPAGQKVVAKQMWNAHNMRIDAVLKSLEVTFSVLQNPTHDGVQRGLEGGAKEFSNTVNPVVQWQAPKRSLTKVAAVMIANDFVEKNRPRIRSTYEAARALLGVLPKSLTSHGKYGGETPLAASWYVVSPYFGLLKEFDLQWLLQVLAPHKLEEEDAAMSSSYFLPTV